MKLLIFHNFTLEIRCLTFALVELLNDRNVLPSFDNVGIDTVLFALNKELYAPAVGVATALRNAGQSVDVVLESKKPKWGWKQADRLGAKYCVVVGAEEFERGEVAIKNLSLGEQETVKINQIAEWVASQQ